MIPWGALLWGVVLSTASGIIAHRRGSLAPTGVAGAVLVGTLLFGYGGIAGGTLLVAFFVSSSVLSRRQLRVKQELAEKFSKGSQRDLAQALANGGLAAVLAGVYFYLPVGWLWAALVGALATVNADTWATELGVLSRTQPRLITNGRVVATGSSGGITRRGTLAALAGALLISALAGLFWISGRNPVPDALWLASAGALGGLAGAHFDSLLGATVQAIYLCEGCGKETERHPLHTCGAATHRTRGWAWLDNDWVNFLSSGVGAALAAALFALGV